MTTDPNKPAPAVVITNERLHEIVDPSRSRAYVAQDEGKSMATELLALRAKPAPAAPARTTEAEFVAALNKFASYVSVMANDNASLEEADEAFSDPPGARRRAVLALFRSARGDEGAMTGLIAARLDELNGLNAEIRRMFCDADLHDSPMPWVFEEIHQRCNNLKNALDAAKRAGGA